MNVERLLTLRDRYLFNEISAEELQELDMLLDEPGAKQLIGEGILNELQTKKYNVDADLVRIHENIQKSISIEHSPEIPVHAIPSLAGRKYFRITAWLKYAAAIIIVVGCAYLYIATKEKPAYVKTSGEISQFPDLSPGGNHAQLTLADGSTITLDNATNGQLAVQGNVSLIKTKDGKLEYHTSKNEVSANGTGFSEVQSYNTMRTPRGGQYQLILPDGSKVWLNSASSLKYPVAFAKNSRRVELQGEAYFEVAANRSVPFVVSTNKTAVTVLGTSFNVNAYDDEPFLNTTLVTGSVKVSNAQTSIIIKPGQQASLAGQSFTTSFPRMEEVLAWKLGKFKFQNTKLAVIMRQISRWYDVDIIYQGTIPKDEFNGSLLRTETPYELLDALSSTDKVHFEILGKKITVIPGAKPKL